MKKAILASVAIVVAVVALTSFKTEVAAPKLYPELESYFKSIDEKNYNKEHLNALENLKSNINFSSMDYPDYNVIFYCTENSFRSQASQVLLQTMCFARKFKKVKAFSAGITASEINPRLISYLSKIGYRITKSEKDGKQVFEVRFSDNASPIILFSKASADASLPEKDIAPVIVCDVKTETDCSNLKTESTPFYMAFPNVTAADSDEKIEEIVKNIAVEVLYITKSK